MFTSIARARPGRFLWCFVPLLLGLLICSLANPLWGQSKSRNPVGSSSRAGSPAGSGTRNAGGRQTRELALQGYCPVCIVEMRKWVKGKPSISAVHDGKVYLFPGAKQRQMFLGNPTKYVPALGGDCVVCYTHQGARNPGSIYHAAISGNRLYLFPNAQHKQAFVNDVNQYRTADVALDGDCAVCRQEMNREVAGRPDINVVHDGMRYLFPTVKQRAMFLANPEKYAITREAKQ